MSWRIPVVAAMVLAAFGAVAFFYYKSYVKKRNYGIVLFVVNGLDSDLLHRARLQTQQARSRQTLTQAKPGVLQTSAADRALLEQPIFHLESFPHLGMLTVQGPGDPVADEGALATALAAGRRVPNGHISVNALARPLTTLLQAAHESGRATGLITTASLTSPTPMAFYTGQKGKPDPHAAAEALTKSGINIIMGGGTQDFEPLSVTNEVGRTDRRNLADEMERGGYTLVRNTNQLNQVQAWRTGQLLGLFAPSQFQFTSGNRNEEQPTLAEMTRRAIECFNYTLGGYFLVIEHGLVQRAAENNFTDLAIEEAKAFDEALRVAQQYAGNDALIVVTNSFSLGTQAQTLAPVLPPSLIGRALTQAPPKPATKAKSRRGKGKAAAKSAPPLAEETLPDTKLLTVPVWLTGPGAVPVSGAQRVWQQERFAAGVFQSTMGEPRFPGLAARFSQRAVPTSQPAWLAARGLFSERFSGFRPNTDVYRLLLERF